MHSAQHSAHSLATDSATNSDSALVSHDDENCFSNLEMFETLTDGTWAVVAIVLFLSSSS